MSRQRKQRGQAGFSLIEVLIVVGILGILAGIAVPNLVLAVRRARQRRTMCDMRTLGAALESYAADHGSYPPAATISCATGLPLPPVEPLNARSFADLTPTYIATPPIRDGWGHVFGYTIDASGSFYVIQSRGEEGDVFETLRCGPMIDFNDDIAYSNGNFVQWPVGGIPPSALSKLAP